MTILKSFVYTVIALFTHVHSRPNVHSDGRIVNGELASVSDYPWLVSLQWTQDGTEGRNVACSGTLIRSSYPAAVLTAAHCCNIGVLSTNAYGYKYYGDIGRQYPHTVAHNDNFTTLRAFFYWNYGGSQQRGYEVNALTDYDACVVLLNGEANDIPSAQLYNPNDITMANECCTEDQAVRALGYGFIDDQGSETDALRYVDTKYMSNIHNCSQQILKCLSEYKDDTVNWRDIVPSDASTLCTRNDEVGVCQGDSGGPLIYTNNDTKAIQIGIVSQSCCIVGVPSMFANVGFFYDSIQGLLADETSWMSYVPQETQTTDVPNISSTSPETKIHTEVTTSLEKTTEDTSSGGIVLMHKVIIVLVLCFILLYTC